MTASDDGPRLPDLARRTSGGPAAPAAPAALPDGDAPGTYHLRPRPMSSRLVLPPAPTLLEGRRLLWRDTSVVLVAIAVIGAIIILLGALGAAVPGSKAPAPGSSEGPAAASSAPLGGAACSGEGRGPGGACYTSDARTAD
jgi:hypothetical protein